MASLDIYSESAGHRKEGEMMPEQSFLRVGLQSEASFSSFAPKQPPSKFKFMKTLSSIQSQFNVLSKKATIKKREETIPVAAPIKSNLSLESQSDKPYTERLSIISHKPNSRSSRTERVMESYQHSRSSSTSTLTTNFR